MQDNEQSKIYAMKFSLLAIIGLFGFQVSFSQTVSIKGVLTNTTGNDTLSLKAFSDDGNKVKKIAINSKTGEFSYTTQLQSAGYFRLGVSDQNFVMLLLSPNDKVVITADATDMFGSAKITGSAQTTLFYEANAAFVDFKKQRDSIQQAFTNQQQLQQLKEENFAINFIKKNPKSLASLMMIDKVSKETHGAIINTLDSNLYLEYPNNKMVQDFHAEIGRQKFLSEGSIAPEIELKDKNGKKVALSSLRGKVVLIDFWATWCGPCKAEIPNLRRIYEEYHEKGFEIYSVSLDRNKDQWINGSGELKWVSVLDEGGAVATQFSIASIPSMFLLDKSGKIVAKNLRGAQLYLKISDMFQ